MTAVKSKENVVAGMGAIAHENGVTFRVWAPNADKVYVVGDFNKWKEKANPLSHEADGYWATNVADANPGDEYRFIIVNGEQALNRIDPYARAVTSSVGNAIVVDTDNYDWKDIRFDRPPLNEVVIYELHIGTFNKTGDQPGDFESVIQKLDYLQSLGVTHIEIMPLHEFAGDYSWGYNPADIFAVESAYGGREWFKTLVESAHARGIGVILDVVYNHFGPSDLALWQFDGWSENDLGGIYFYNDWRAETPWGDTRPDYGRPQVRQYIRDNAMMWLKEFRVDGLRWDMTPYVRTVNGADDKKIEEGWTLMQALNSEMHEVSPGALAIAEDMHDIDAMVMPVEEGGAGFDAQWTGAFVHTIRAALIAADDSSRDMQAVANAIKQSFAGRPFSRVVYTESHDEVANGQARVVEEIAPGADDNALYFAKKRSTLGAALIMTSPGVPMLFMGQEFLEDDWFDDQRPIEWERAEKFAGIVQLHRDLIRLRRNIDGKTRGLLGGNVDVYHVNNDSKVVAFHRWAEGGPEDSTIVVVNFSSQVWPDYKVGVPAGGEWKVRFNSDASAYDDEFDDVTEPVAIAEDQDYDGFEHHIALNLGAYSAVILSKDA